MGFSGPFFNCRRLKPGWWLIGAWGIGERVLVLGMLVVDLAGFDFNKPALLRRRLGVIVLGIQELKQLTVDRLLG